MHISMDLSISDLCLCNIVLLPAIAFAMYANKTCTKKFVLWNFYCIRN